jgi:hypothetical protein
MIKSFTPAREGIIVQFSVINLINYNYFHGSNTFSIANFLKNDFHSKADGWENYDISAENFAKKTRIH